MTGTRQDTLAQEKKPMNLDAIKKRMTDGKEPTEMLFSLLSSPLIDLKGRALAKILTAEDNGRKVVLAIIYDAEWDGERGIVLSVGKTPVKSVGKSEAE